MVRVSSLNLRDEKTDIFYVVLSLCTVQLNVSLDFVPTRGSYFNSILLRGPFYYYFEGVCVHWDNATL